MLASEEFYHYRRNDDVNKNNVQLNLKSNTSNQLYLEDNFDNADNFTSVANQVVQFLIN